MIHCFYHSADLDGHCSGAIVKYRFPDAMMHPINYGDPFPWEEFQQEDEVYMVDFSVQPWTDMERLMQECHLTWIDHHSSAIQAYVTRKPIHRSNCSARIDTTKAACEITWEYLFPYKPVPLAVKLLSLYDSWSYQGHELEDMVLPFQMRIRMEDLDPKDWEKCALSWDEFFRSSLDSPSNHPSDRFSNSQWVREGRLLLRYDEAQKAKYAKTYAFETSLIHPAGMNLWKAIAVNLGHTNSKVFDSVWDDAKYDLMITFVRRTDKLWNVSLYSTKPEIDCGVIAKNFGGGGHKWAAGFQCKELPFEY